MTGTASALRQVPLFGEAVMPPGSTNLSGNVTASGQYVSTGVQVVLPEPGTYELEADVRAAISVPSGNQWVSARLFNSAAGAMVPASERLIVQGSTNGTVGVAQNITAPLHAYLTVNGPTTVRLEGARYDSIANASTSASILSDGNGRTSLRFTRIS
jgi:hypothetical protein